MISDAMKEILEDTMTESEKRTRDEANRRDAEKKLQEVRRRAEQSDLKDRFINAVRNDNVFTAKSIVDRGLDTSFFDEGLASHTCNVISNVKSANMLEFLLGLMNTNNTKHKKVAELFVKEALYNNKTCPDRIIQLAKERDLSLNPAMEGLAYQLKHSSALEVIGLYQELAKAGVRKESFDLEFIARYYSSSKNGTDTEFGWRDPNPKAAEEAKKVFIAVKESLATSSKTFSKDYGITDIERA